MTKGEPIHWIELDVSAQDRTDAHRIFSKKAKFLVDNCIHADFINALRKDGYNVLKGSEAGLKASANDEQYFALAQREDRILITQDEDYLNDRQFPPHGNPGIVIIPAAGENLEPLVRAFLALCRYIAPYRELWRKSKIKIEIDGSTTYLTLLAIDYTGRRYKNKFRIDKRGVWDTKG